MSYHFVLSQHPLVDFANSSFGFREGAGRCRGRGVVGGGVMTTRLCARAFSSYFRNVLPLLLASKIHVVVLVMMSMIVSAGRSLVAGGQ